MRIIFLILSLLVYVGLMAQSEADISVSYEKENVSLEGIFEDLEEQYGIRFSYSSTAMTDIRVDAKFVDKPLVDVLDKLLIDQNMEYKIVSNNVLLRKTNTYIETQNDAYKSALHIRGKVVLKNDQESVFEYATVSILNTSIGTYTNSKGLFDLEIPEKYLENYLVVSYVGFQDCTYKISELEDHYVLTQLSEDLQVFDEVVIVNKEKPIKIGSANGFIGLNSSLINGNTSDVMGADINRKIQLLPGVSAHDDDSADIKVRGSNSDETLMILDGMPIYNASHYYGIFSGLNAAYIDSLNLYKNAYPLYYGGKTAGLVELFSNRSMNNKPKTSLAVDLLTASANTSIPITKNSKLQLSARSTIKDINNNQFNTFQTPQEGETLVQDFESKLNNAKRDPKFYFFDVNAKYQWSPNQKERLSLNLFYSNDNVDNLLMNRIRDRKDNEVNISIREEQNWSTLGSSFLWSRRIGDKLDLNSRLYFTKYNNDESHSIFVEKKFQNGGQPPINNPLGDDQGSRQRNNLTDFGVDIHGIYNLGKSALKFGVFSSQNDVDYSFRENNQTNLEGKLSIVSLGGFVGYAIDLTERFNVDFGVRGTYYDNIDDLLVSPRAMLSYKLSNRVALKSSFSISQQVIRQLYYEYRGEPMELWVSSGQNNIPVLRSQNYMIGSTFRWSGLILDMEVYQKDMDGVIEYATINPGSIENNPNVSNDYQLFKGQGLTRGIDVILGTGYRSYDTYLSYTLSKSVQRFKEIFKNKYFASENDRRHQLKWINTYSLQKWSFGMNLIYTSGRRYTDVANFNINEDIRDKDPVIRLKRLPAYHRVDVNAGYDFKLFNKSTNINFSVFNLLNTQNVKYVQSVATQLANNQLPVNAVLGNESRLLNRTINVGVKMDF